MSERNPPTHGTVTMYRRHGCRCDPCKEAQRRSIMDYRRSRGVRQRPQPTARHGTRAMYRKGCRCEPCCVANREYQREYMREFRTYGNRRRAAS